MDLDELGHEASHAARRSSSIVLALAWGLLWAPVLGTWVVFPHFLRTQRIHPMNLAQWALLEALLSIVFAGFGLIGSLVIWGVLTLWNRLRGRGFSDPGWAYALCVLLGLPVLYFLTAAVTELAIFRSLVGFSSYRPFLWTFVGSYTLVCGLFLFLYREIVRRRPRPRLTPLASSGIAALVVGLALAPLWGEPAFDPKSATEQLRPVGDAPKPKTPLLFVGIDSGSWKILQPLLDAGKAPTFQQLITSGTKGEVRAAWVPVWSAPAWAAIVTGYPREQTGIYQEYAASASHLPPIQVPLEFDFLLDPLYLVEYKLAAASGYLHLTPFPRSALLRQPIWELLHTAGVKVAVVRFMFTFPAEGQGSFVISDYVGTDISKVLGLWTQASSGSVAPAELAPSLLARFSGPPHDAKGLASALLPGSGPFIGRDAWISPGDSLRIAADVDERTVDASLDLLRSQPNVAAMFVYLGGFDTVCHAFWRYRFPQEFPEDPPGDEEAREFGPVIDRYLEFVDDAVGKLIRSYPTPPDVIVLADHGHEALHGNRTYTGAHSRRDGMFIAAGPSIPHWENGIEVSYFDLAPTVLELMGFAPLSDMQGTSLLRAATSR